MSAPADLAVAAQEAARSIRWKKLYWRRIVSLRTAIKSSRSIPRRLDHGLPGCPREWGTAVSSGRKRLERHRIIQTAFPFDHRIQHCTPVRLSVDRRAAP